MNQQLIVTIIFGVLGLLVSMGLAVVGYFLSDLRVKFTDLTNAILLHHNEDNERFQLIDAKLDAMKEDIVEKRHKVAGEMRDAFARVGERVEKIDDRLRVVEIKVEKLS